MILRCIQFRVAFACWLIMCALPTQARDAQRTAAVPAPHSLTVEEGFSEPIGLHDPTPRFSWKLPEGTTSQTAYHIRVHSRDNSLWDSGWVDSAQSVLAPYGAEPLKSRDRAKWQVRFRDENGEESAWSDAAHFELGLLSAADWRAQWIRPAGEHAVDVERVGWLRRRFSLQSNPAQARLYVTARGLFEVRLNGRRVGDDHFANGWTSYHKRLDSLTYDVAEHLQAGDNVIEVTLGTGWYAGRFPFGTKEHGPYGAHPEALLQLEVAHRDGSRETVLSDGEWEGTFEGPIISSSIYDGEVYDARRQLGGWQPVLADPDLGAARLIPKPFPPVRQTQTLTPQAITEPEPGRYIFDLGQNIVGWARINVPVVDADTITLRFAEMLKQDGTLYTENYRSARSMDTYTAASTGWAKWEPHFTFHGFRYVEISGLAEDAEPENDWVTGVVLHSDLRRTGAFESSHAKLNQLQSNIAWGWRGNALDIPTDCPQRDERLGWTGDAQVFGPTAMFNTDSWAFWKSWLQTMREDQEEDGSIPDVIPAIVHWKSSPGWMDAATIIPWELYVRSGDQEVLLENFAMMEKLVGFYRSKSANGVINDLAAYGDWLQPFAKNREGDTPAPLLATAYYAHSVDLLARAAQVIGQDDKARRYATESKAVRSAFAQRYFDSAGKLTNAPETQTAYVLAIAFELIPDAMREKAAQHLARLVHDADDHLRTGFLGTPHIVRVLDESGRSELACKLLFQETYPSWFYSINQGATTMWERWNSYSHADGFGDATMNSFNHYAYGAVGQWMYERIAGLAPDPANPGYKHFYVRPLIPAQLESAAAELETPYGLAACSWEKQNGELLLRVVVPPNATATAELPDGGPPRLLPAGRHHIRFEVAHPDSN